MNKIVEKIINSLSDATKDNNIEWSLKKSIFNSDTSHRYESKSIDGKTSFEISISLDRSYNLLYGGILNINNSLLSNELYLAHSSDYKGIKNIEFLIYEKYIKSNIILKNEDIVLEDILNNIGDKSYSRDKKLDKILDNDNDIESLGFFKNIFRKQNG